MGSITFKHVYKQYKGEASPSVNDFNLSVDDGEFLVLVGPSGCGKSTTLRMLAGLEDITQGEIYIDDKFINYTSPKNRDIAMVFQNYALYPNLSVYENMALGLKLRKTAKHDIELRVTRAARILEMAHLLEKKPNQLSGGQKQRVALGRAIVREPKVFLMDEPLSNLDAKLRAQTRAELIKLHSTIRTTTVYVTHDQVEAMTMGTRIVVMKDGIIQQVASPHELYNAPVNLFVAGFIGSPQMNLVKGSITRQDGVNYFVNKRLKLPIPIEHAVYLKNNDFRQRQVVLGIRPEQMTVVTGENRGNEQWTVNAVVELMELMGADTFVYVSLGDNQLIVRMEAHTEVRVGDNVQVQFNMNKSHFFDQNTGGSLRVQGDAGA
ncbi:ABC transporter ATP-binding protein [Cohnella silvisoli]|uniref:Sn-glycerol-3-phosphate ABC transporter ATP-binding protein UgpC n=1 Tax=Cohnella silvisoli TaxID=2873699 RepID=A0ABV1L3S0_9BACL|nr:sn-glycerol-3-phosphate ABC transporter ATP-binding protein UgpC [Cohnella silvisoli]MCD9026173.1 sn-glycerol-3-phosphate ABC transporter ATP-binding protein UgpC [Cohnella silvisoli]